METNLLWRRLAQEDAARREEARKRQLRHDQLVVGSTKQGHHPSFNPLSGRYADDELNASFDKEEVERAASQRVQHSLKNSKEHRGWDIISGLGDDEREARKGRAVVARTEREWNILVPMTAPAEPVAMPAYKERNIAMKFASRVTLRDDVAPPAEDPGHSAPRSFSGQPSCGYNLIQIGAWADDASGAVQEKPARKAYREKYEHSYNILAPGDPTTAAPAVASSRR